MIVYACICVVCVCVCGREGRHERVYIAGTLLNYCNLLYINVVFLVLPGRQLGRISELIIVALYKCFSVDPIYKWDHLYI